jgi:hypothetical protein
VIVSSGLPNAGATSRLVGVQVATTVRSESMLTVQAPVPGHSNTLQPTKPAAFTGFSVTFWSCPTVYWQPTPSPRVWVTLHGSPAGTFADSQGVLAPTTQPTAGIAGSSGLSPTPVTITSSVVSARALT